MRLEVSPAQSDREIFLAALQLADDEQRLAFLDRVCGGDAERRREVDRLLAADDGGSASPLDQAIEELSPAVTKAVDVPPSEHFDMTTFPQIDRYQLLEQIGEGGMGAVFKAQQTEPVKRMVALKLIKRGMGSREVIARFQTERQALAMMDHPNIARVFDGGATDSGQPFFVMELVQGVPITEFCDQKRMTPSSRLELFVGVCQAVQHAHQKGIIHRDLKPTNILVTEIDGKAIPKVIDFGVAKATHQPLTDQTVHAQYSQMVGTPLYMSPEQAAMGVIDVDTRSDVYSLGVILYELLTGSTPFDRAAFENATFDEVRRIIREDEPKRPNAMVSTLNAKAESTVAERRGIDARKLRDSLAGELDWLVMKTLEKDRSRRYESVSALADDVERYLADEPVLACPPSTVYRLKKLAKRHSGALTAAALCLAMLLAGLAATSWYMFRAIRAESLASTETERAKQQAAKAEGEAARAEEEAATAEAINQFVMQDLLAQANHTIAAAPDPDVRLKDVLDRAAPNVRQRFGTQPRVRASIELTLARIYESLGEFPVALDLAQRSFATRQQELGPNDPKTLASKHAVAWVLSRDGQYEAAEVMLKETWEARSNLLGERHPATLKALADLGSTIASLGRLAEAEQIQREVLAAQRETKDQQDEQSLADSAVSLGITLNGSGRYDEAMELYQEALEIYQRIEQPSGVAMTLGNMAATYLRLGDLENAEDYLNQSVDQKTKYLGEEHYWTAADLGNLGVLCGMQRRHAESETYFRQALEILRRRLGIEHPETRNAMQNLCITLCALERYGEAVTLAKERLNIISDQLGEEEPRAIAAIDLLMETLGRQGDVEQAFQWQQKQLTLTRNAFGNEHPQTMERIAGLAGALAASARYDDADPLFREALDLRRTVVGDDDLTTLVAAKNLEILYLVRAQELLRDSSLSAQQAKVAVEWAREALQLQRKTADRIDELAEYWQQQGSGELGYRSAKDGLNLLGVALYREGKWQEAMEALQQVDELTDAGDRRYRFFMAMAYWQQGKKDQALHLYEQAVTWMHAQADLDEDLLRIYAEAMETLNLDSELPSPNGKKEPTTS